MCVCARPFLLCSCFFLYCSPVLSGLILLERGGKPLHDEVGVHCRMGSTTENQAQVPSIWAKLDDRA